MQNRALIFSWPSKHDPQFVLLGMLALAAMVHALAFYLFHTVNSAPQPQSTSIATIYLLNQNSLSDASLNQWLEAEDPSLFIKTTVASPATLPDISYVPSYESERPTLATRQTPTLPVPVPIGPVPGPVSLHSPIPQIPQISEKIAGTRLVVGGGLAGRCIQSSPHQEILASPLSPNLPCTFFTAVDPNGRFRYIFLLHSSGNSELDQMAMKNLQQLRLEPVSTTTQWGTIPYLWGMRAL